METKTSKFVCDDCERAFIGKVKHKLPGKTVCHECLLAIRAENRRKINLIPVADRFKLMYGKSID